MATRMEQFSIFCILCVIIVSSSATPISKRQLSCDHPLRVSLPHLFSHCTSACTYTTWSGWQVVENSVVTVPTSQCSSGQAYSEKRTRAGIGSGCTEATTETRSICKPDREDSLIIALGLGSSVDQRTILRPLEIVNPSNATLRQIRQANSQYCPIVGTTNHICSNLLGKRSVNEDEYAQEMYSQIQASSQLQDNTEMSVPVLPETVPVQFDWKEHGNRLMRHRRQTRCSGSVQHVLFVLDSSGSINPANYNRMKAAVASLTSLFCMDVHFALLTFSSSLNLDFCFNCYSNNRVLAAQAIINATHQRGRTNTGAAAKCICDHLLHPNCGISVDPNCLDVIFITDGRSNDRTLNICNEVACLHNHYGINTYAVGIGNNYDQRELRCISDQSDMFNQFEYVDFNDFDMSINEIVRRLVSGDPSYTCTLPQDVLT